MNDIKTIIEDTSQTEFILSKNTFLGKIYVKIQEDKLIELHFSQSKYCPNKNTYYKNDEKLTIFEDIFQQIEEYFKGLRKSFDIIHQLSGTEFQLLVWNRIKNISYGETISYMQIAKDIGMPRSVRAVANAVGKNPISIIIPCHRIIGSNGSMTGYAGGIKLKKELLEIESNFK